MSAPLSWSDAVIAAQFLNQITVVERPRRVAMHAHDRRPSALVDVMHAHARAAIEKMRLEREQSLVKLGYQMTSAIEQFRPLPMPSMAMRWPFWMRPASTALESTIGVAAGPMLPNSG